MKDFSKVPKFKSSKNLQEAMQVTHPTPTDFQAFKATIQAYYHQLNTKKYSYEQDPEDWKAFIKEVTARQPALCYYEKCWPISHYFDYLVADTVREEKYLQKSSTSGVGLIPRPQNGKRTFRTLYYLGKAMQSTHPSIAAFSGFKKLVQDLSKELLQRGYKEDQDSTKWSMFIQRMLLNDPKLAIYEQCWPAEFYFNALRRRGREKTALVPATKKTSSLTLIQHFASTTANPTTLSQTASTLQLPSSTTANQTFTFVTPITSGQPSSASGTRGAFTTSMDPFPQAVNSEPSDLHEQDLFNDRESPMYSFSRPSQLSTSMTPTPVISQPRSPILLSQPTQSPPSSMPGPTMFQCSSTFSSPPNSLSLISPMPPQTCERISDKGAILASCLFCRPLMEVQTFRHPSSTRRLSAFAANDDNVLRALASVGIVFDQHVDALLFMDRWILERLVDSSPAEELKGATKYRLLFLWELAKGKRGESDQMSFDGPETTDIIQVPCPLHPPVDISAMPRDLRRLLRIYGVDELSAAVAHMGLLTLQDFKHFCNLSKSARITIITNLRIQLNHFQGFMLNRALQANAMLA